MRYNPEPQSVPQKILFGGRTFITPFIVSTCLALPSLLAIAYSKQAAGYSMLVDTEYYSIIMSALGSLLAVSFTTSLLYVWLGGSHVIRAAVVILEIVAVACFLYITLFK